MFYGSTSKSLRTGAIAAGVGEVGTAVLANTVYGKSPSQLNDEEKQTLINASKALAGAATAMSAAANGSNGATILAEASVGMTVAENAVENNAVNKEQAGTPEGFEIALNSTMRKVGLSIGDDAEKYLLEFGEIENFQPSKTGFSNRFKDRYIYTEVGGWIDMTHFLFYAGQAYKNKLNTYEELSRYIGFVPQNNEIELAISKKARLDAIKLGYLQEVSDIIFASHSKFSYEDLPSDRFGAEFGSKYFNKYSSQSLGEQVRGYLTNELKATKPTLAPNYNELPKEDLKKHPGFYNFSTNSVYRGEK